MVDVEFKYSWSYAYMFCTSTESGVRYWKMKRMWHRYCTAGKKCTQDATQAEAGTAARYAARALGTKECREAGTPVGHCIMYCGVMRRNSAVE